MRGLSKLTWIELKLFLREPAGAFLQLLFPVSMLFLFGCIWGNKPTPFFGGYGYVDVSVPAFTAIIIATTGLVSLTIWTTSSRERGILRRLRATPLRPQMILVSSVIVLFLVTALGMGLLIVVGKLVYGLRFDGNVFSVVGGFVLSCMSFFAVGFVLAGLMRTERTAQAVTMVIFYPMIFLSGATVPREVMPPNVRSFSEVLPLTHVVNLLRGLWIGDAWAAHLPEVAFLVAMLLIGLVVSIKTFRWE